MTDARESRAEPVPTSVARENGGDLRIPLEPVDAVTITTIMDDVTDVFMPDQGPAHRKRPGPGDRLLRAETMVPGIVPEPLLAEHGLSLLVSVRVSHGGGPECEERWRLV